MMEKEGEGATRGTIETSPNLAVLPFCSFAFSLVLIFLIRSTSLIIIAPRLRWLSSVASRVEESSHLLSEKDHGDPPVAISSSN